MYNPFTDNTSIHIRLTRNENADQDDRIVIRYEDNDYYQIYYRDGLLRKGTFFCTLLQSEELEKYLESLMRLLALDRDPFESFQLMMPCYPTLMYKPEDLKKKSIRSLIQEMVPLLQSAMKLCV